MYEALEATKSIFTSPLETEYQDLSVRFQVVAFSPLPLWKPLRPPAGTATLIKKLKDSKTLEIHHVFHEQDQLQQCLSHLFNAETYASSNSLDRSVLGPCYAALEDAMRNSKPSTKILDNLKKEVKKEFKMALEKASGGAVAETEQMTDYLDKLAKHPTMQYSFATRRTVFPVTAALAPIRWQSMPGGDDMAGYFYSTMYVMLIRSRDRWK